MTSTVAASNDRAVKHVTRHRAANRSRPYLRHHALQRKPRRQHIHRRSPNRNAPAMASISANRTNPQAQAAPLRKSRRHRKEGSTARQQPCSAALPSKTRNKLCADGILRGSACIATSEFIRDVIIACAVALPMMVLGIFISNRIHANLKDVDSSAWWQ